MPKPILFLQCDDDFNTRGKGKKTHWKKGIGGYQLYNLCLNLHQLMLGDDWLENSFTSKRLKSAIELGIACLKKAMCETLEVI